MLAGLKLFTLDASNSKVGFVLTEAFAWEIEIVELTIKINAERVEITFLLTPDYKSNKAKRF